MGSVGRSSVVTAVHYTKRKNVQSIIANGFDESRSGENFNFRSGPIWGAGAYYLEPNSAEAEQYSKVLKTKSFVQSEIDTSNFLQVTLQSSYDNPLSSNSVKLYDDASKAFDASTQREYETLKNKYTPSTEHKTQRLQNMERFEAGKRAFTELAKQKYDGVVIKQPTKNGRIDAVAGGNQIIVYNQQAIKTKKAGK